MFKNHITYFIEKNYKYIKIINERTNNKNWNIWQIKYRTCDKIKIKNYTNKKVHIIYKQMKYRTSEKTKNYKEIQDIVFFCSSIFNVMYFM